MEDINKKLLINKGGSSGTSYRISLPVKFLKQIGINENENTVTVALDEDNHQIIIKKNYLYLLNKAIEILKSLELKSVHGNVRNTLKSRLNSILSECYNKGIDIEFLAVDFPIIKEINVYKNSDDTASVVVVFEHNFKLKEDVK